ncbi:MAG: glycosyltransferase family 2 protein [Patescibacteria group bacterium]|mgnify:FL=1
MDENRVAIIVLNYNGQGCLLPCLKSLEALTYEEKTIIVVDNGSQDESFEQAQRAFPKFVYLKNNQNKGFSGGMNTGIRYALEAGIPWVWLFNYDALAEKDALTLLLAGAAGNSSARLLSPVVLNEKKEEWFSGGRINYLRMRAEHTPSLREKTPYRSEYLSGCALLIHREVFEKIGFLDEDFFLYYEDVDFSLRARKAGFSCLVVPESRVTHSEQSNFNPSKVYHLVLSGLLFFEKHTPWHLRPYIFGYVTIRRVKNRIDVWLGREAASMVQKAYATYFSRIKAKSLSDLH